MPTNRDMYVELLDLLLDEEIRDLVAEFGEDDDEYPREYLEALRDEYDLRMRQAYRRRKAQARKAR